MSKEKEKNFDIMMTTAQLFTMIDMMPDFIEQEGGKEDADFFVKNFYMMADSRRFFDKRSPEEVLRDNLKDAGISDEHVDEIVDIAVKLGDILFKESEKDDETEHIEN